MEFSYLIGLFENLDMDIMPWIFTIVIVLLVMTALALFIYYKKLESMKKSMLIMGYIGIWLFLGGIIGLVIAGINYLIVHAFVSDFKSNYN